MPSPWHGGKRLFVNPNCTSAISFICSGSLLQRLHRRHWSAPKSVITYHLQADYLLTEDAPAPAAIHSFKAHVKEGKIHVTANMADTLKENKSRQATLVSTAYEVGQRGLVIVGGGSGALHSVESLREVNHKCSCFLKK